MAREKSHGVPTHCSIVRASTLLSITLAFLMLFPAVAAGPPWDEINDIQWCVDQASRTVQNTVRSYAAWLASTYDANYRALKCKLHQHAPIIVGGAYDPDLGNVVGVTGGSGTAGDPYIIENWEIAGSDSATVFPPVGGAVTTPKVDEWNGVAGAGITIFNTDDHFLIRKVYIHGFTKCATVMIAQCSWWRVPAGIRIDDAPNVRIEDSLILDNTVGVSADLYSDTPRSYWLVRGNTIRANLGGVYGQINGLIVEGNSIHVTGTQSAQITGPFGVMSYPWIYGSNAIRWNSIYGPGSGHGTDTSCLPYVMTISGNSVWGWAQDYYCSN